jgi:hypothetical protein
MVFLIAISSDTLRRRFDSMVLDLMVVVLGLRAWSNKIKIRQLLNLRTMRFSLTSSETPCISQPVYGVSFA